MFLTWAPRGLETWDSRCTWPLSPRGAATPEVTGTAPCACQSIREVVDGATSSQQALCGSAAALSSDKRVPKNFTSLGLEEGNPPLFFPKTRTPTLQSLESTHLDFGHHLLLVRLGQGLDVAFADHVAEI